MRTLSLKPQGRVAAALKHVQAPAAHRKPHAATPTAAASGRRSGGGGACRLNQRRHAAQVRQVQAASSRQDARQLDQQQQRRQQGGIEAEILSLALPTLATLAADPVASLISTAFVGRLGATQLAAAGVALSVFNTASKLLSVPLLAITTSSVAQALGAEQLGGKPEAGGISATVSAAVQLALVVGFVQALVLGLLGPGGLAAWGAGPGSPLFADAAAYLSARAMTAPATVLMLVLQGCFRGLGDTRTPFVGTLLANALNIVLEYLLLFGLGWGVRGAALAVGLSQAAACVVLLVLLQRRCPLQLAGGDALRRSLGYLGSTGLLALRTLAIMGVYAVATSLAARTDPAHAAAHQIAFQVWLASSLLADSLAVAAQTLLARSLAAGQQAASKVVIGTTLRMAVALGSLLAAGLALGRDGVAALFSSDPAVLACVAVIMPAVVLTQPINALAFLADGILYGVGGFGYAAVAMVLACLPAGAVMLIGSQLAAGSTAALDSRLQAVWLGLALLMLLRFLSIWLPLQLRRWPFDKLEA